MSGMNDDVVEEMLIEANEAILLVTESNTFPTRW